MEEKWSNLKQSKTWRQVLSKNCINVQNFESKAKRVRKETVFQTHTDSHW